MVMAWSLKDRLPSMGSGRVSMKTAARCCPVSRSKKPKADSVSRRVSDSLTVRGEGMEVGRLWVVALTSCKRRTVLGFRSSRAVLGVPKGAEVLKTTWQWWLLLQVGSTR